MEQDPQARIRSLLSAEIAPIDLDREDDGHWIAEIPDLPGVLCPEAPARSRAVGDRPPLTHVGPPL
jgi:hypothetical protein